MLISLNKANKILSKLKAAHGGGNGPRNRLMILRGDSDFDQWVVSASVIGTTVETAKPVFEEAVRRSQDSLNEHLQIAHDLGELKEALHAANHRTGISARLQRIHFLNQKINLYRNGLANVSARGIVDVADIDEGYLAGIQSLENDSSKAISVRIMSPDHLQTAIDQARIEISSLEDEIASLNATTEIDVDLSDASKRAAGIPLS